MVTTCTPERFVLLLDLFVYFYTGIVHHLFMGEAMSRKAQALEFRSQLRNIADRAASRNDARGDALAAAYRMAANALAQLEKAGGELPAMRAPEWGGAKDTAKFLAECRAAFNPLNIEVASGKFICGSCATTNAGVSRAQCAHCAKLNSRAGGDA